MQCCVLKLLISICSSFEKRAWFILCNTCISFHITRRQIESIPVNEILIILIFLFSQKFISMKPYKYVIWFVNFFHFFFLALCTNPRGFATSGVCRGGVSILLLLPLIASDHHPNNQTHINTLLSERLWTLRADGDFKFSCTVLTLRNT